MIINRITTILMALILVGCYNSTDKHYTIPTLDPATTTIASLRNTIGANGATINEGIILRGRVTSSDSEDNIYRSIFVEDNTAAVEVLIGFTPLNALYPEGLEVALHIKGCRVGYWREVLQIGTKALGGGINSVDYINSREGVDLVVERGSNVSPLIPLEVDISDLHKDMCGRLVRIRGIEVVSSTSIDTLIGETLSDACWRGSAMFKSATGDSIAVFTNNMARYANNALPLSTVSITGILKWGSYASTTKECYHITMRYENDCVDM